MRLFPPRHSLLALLVLALTLSGCTKPQPGDQGGKAGALETPMSEVAGATVATVVYVDQESCCDCTRERQDKTWANLQAVLGAMEVSPKVQVVHLDTQAEDAQLYLDLKPIMVPPGLYFFDGNEVLAEMIQGELSQEQIGKALGQ